MTAFDGAPSGLSFAMIGTGAMGGSVATLLAAAGEQIVYIDTDAAVVETANRNGFRLEGALGSHQANVRAYTAAPADVEVDVAIVLATTNDTADAAETAKQLLKPDGLAITMQNGIGNIETLQAALGDERVAGASTKSSAQRLGPAHSELTKIDPTTVGALQPGQAERVEAVVAALDRTGFTTVQSDNILGVIWSKLIHNVAINPICASSGLVQAETARVPELESLRALLVAEAVAVARAKGIQLIDPDPLEKLRAHTAAKRTRPSMLQHLDLGRVTEIGAINGAIVREAEALGMEAPANQAILGVIRGIEHAHRIADKPLHD